MYGFGEQCQGGGLRLGDKLTAVLEFFGITKQGWAKLRGKENCKPCSERQEKLNRIGLSQSPPSAQTR